ncbi:ABC transporter ATP-binding protein [Herbiconiux moechotypicola]|uniref:ABC transporter ATP-binding protein n=1 Tax=Herbiconiux moechotypicola TaxID=637393 RepID=A0ABP5QIK1_9MICO|nr:ABC transporter ATP-binding protein [Herbiconiux moechotypicola]MCS5730047.1 ABC transporter ATP-binding protein [Herbiconiux moechotypicola]
MPATQASVAPASELEVDFAHASTVLAVDALSVTYGSGESAHRAVDSATFRIAHGERVALVGESGSGKTTLALAIAGFLLGDAVTIDYAGLELGGEPLRRGSVKGLPQKTPGITMVFQDAMTSLDPVWTIGSQLAAVLRGAEGLRRSQVRERSEHWLRMVGLHDTERVLGARPYELSGGMRQRAMLAIALCSRPRLLIADEPTSALDASLAREIMDLMVDLTEDFGTSVLVVSHDIHLCQEYADRILVMLGGVIVDDVPAAEAAARATHPYTKGLIECVPTLESAGLDELPTLAGLREAGAW